MKVSVIIPVHNEKETLPEILKQLQQLSFEKEIIVVDDASTDGSLETITDVIKITHAENLGKGAAIKSGLERATGEVVLIQDADLEYDPKDIAGLLKPFENSQTQVVFGYRTSPGYKLYYLGNKFFTFFVNLLFGSDLKDPYTGYKVVRTDLFKSLDLKNNGFEIEAEITSKILKRKISIVQVPISYHPRTFEKGKKIRLFRDGFRGLWTFFRFWLGRKDSNLR